MSSSSFLNRGLARVIAFIICTSGYAASLPPAYAAETANKAKAKVNLINLAQTYDGSPKSAGARTEPRGLTVIFTYDKSTLPPTNAGIYTVVGTVHDAGYEGSATAKMTIAKARQKIVFNVLAARTYGEAPFELFSTVSSGLTATYESSKPAVATVSGNKVTITGAGSTWITVYQAGDKNYFPAKPVRQALTIAKAGQKIAFDAPRTATYGDADFNPEATANSNLPVLYKSSNSKVATVIENRIHIVGPGSSTLTASQPGDKNYRAAEPVRQELTVSKAKARVFLAGLDQTYDGAPKSVVAETMPRGLKVAFTYDGSAAPPTNAGSHAIVGVVQDANYEGSVSATLTIAKAGQKITFDAPVTATFGSADFSPGAEASSGLPAIYTSSDPKVATVVENRIHIVGPGSSTITASQPGDNNYIAAEPVKKELTVSKAKASVILTGLDQTYDGTAKRAGARTEPEGLGVTLTYDNKSQAPSNAGAYTIVGRIQDANYEGSAEGMMTIVKAVQTIAFNVLPTRTYGEGPFALSSTVSSGLTATYESSNPDVAVVSGNKVRIVGAGTAVITAYQAGDTNYQAAEPVKQALFVNKATAKVSLTGLAHTYDGAAKSAGALTDPKGLTVVFTYDNNAEAPTKAGTYTVAGAVQDMNYEGRTEGSMTIAKAPQSITFDALAARTYGDMPFALSSTVSSSLTATYESSNAAIATISGSEVTVVGAGMTEITAYQAGDENHLPAKPVGRMLTINKATQKIDFGALTTRTYGDGPFALSSTVTSGLTATYVSSDSAVATVSGSEVRIGGVGSAVITAYQGGDNNYLAAEPVKQVLTVNKAPQSITFNALPTRTYGDERPFLLYATVSSGLTAAYDGSNSAVAIVIGNEVKTVGAGTVVITAYQAGDKNYLPAKPVQQTLIVNKAKARVTIMGLTHTYDGKPKSVNTRTDPAGLNVTVTYDGGTQSPTNAGRYRVSATVNDANYEGSAGNTMTIAKAAESITFKALPVRTVGDAPFTLSSTVSTGLTALYESSDSSVATISGSEVKITGAGTTWITAYQPGDNNYGPAELVKQLLIVRGKPPRIVVFPVENLSNRLAPLKAIRQSIVEVLTRQGDVVLDDATMDQFMARHRVRYTGGVDTFTAQAWKEETGAEAVLVTSVDQYDDNDPPKISLTSRLVSTGDIPYILWMEDVGLSGDDAPGLFGRGLIHDIGVLQVKAISRVLDSLAEFYADKTATGKGGTAKALKPKVAYQAYISNFNPDRKYTVAVLPFFNRSKNSKAGEILALRFIAELVKEGTLQVLEPGVVRQKLLNYRVVMRDGVSKAVAESFFNNLETDQILMGRVLDYQENSPKMEFDVQVYERKSKAMVWSSWSHNQGNDGVFFFDLKRVNNAGVLASEMVEVIVRAMSAE